MQLRSITSRCHRVVVSVSRKTLTLSLAAACVAGAATKVHAAADVVLYTSDVTTVQGNWTKAQSATGAGGMTMQSKDYGWSSPNAPMASPADYFEATFSAPAGVSYHVWLRLSAANNSKYNDSVWVQFSDAQAGGSSIYPIGSTAGLAVNLENCAGCGDSGWGWQDKAYWLTQTNIVQFATTGSHTIRVQTREDGVMVDQIVLSPSTYLSSAPGSVSNDSTIVPKPATASSSSSGGSTLAYSGSPVAIPGQVNGENFDTGGEGVSYHDTTPGNTGGQYRNTNVDIENSAEGGYDIGWIAPGEWLNYTVNVGSAGSYSVQLRVSSPNGATMHVGFNSPSSVWSSVSVPATGGWQNWTTISVPVTLGAGVQQLTVLFDSGGMNYRYAKVTSGSTGGSSGGSASSSPYGGTAAAVPGRIAAANFDDGGQGVAYYDTTPGNAGGQYRSTDVDIEASSEGGYDIGWTAAGEWLNYTVNVASAGSYTAQLRVASPNGGSIHVGFNTASNVWASVSVPATGGWQNWTTVNVPVTLGAGTQQMTITFDTGGTNFEYVNVAADSGGSTGSGGTLNVVTWNIQINDSSAAHAKDAMDRIAGLSPLPQVVVIQEAHLSQYNAYVTELQNRTGQTWQGVMQTHCPPGYWAGSYCSGSEDEGVAVFTTLPVVNSSKLYLPYADQWHSARATVRLAVNFSGTTIQVWGTHLQTDPTPRNQAMALIKTWVPNYAAPQVLGGDLNADMDQIDVPTGLYPNFTDSWALVGAGSGYTASTPSPTMKLDYWLSDASLKAQPSWTQVNTSTGTVSDHFPVQTTFTIRP